MEEGSDNELDESLLSTMKKGFLGCTRDGTDVVISYVGSSTNRELQTYYEHLRIVREILIKQHERFVSTELGGLFKSSLFRSKTSTPSLSFIDEQMYVLRNFFVFWELIHRCSVTRPALATSSNLKICKCPRFFLKYYIFFATADDVSVH